MDLTALLKRRNDLLDLTVRLDPYGDDPKSFEFVLSCADAAFPVHVFRCADMLPEGARILKKKLTGTAAGTFPAVTVMAIFNGNYVGQAVART